MGTMWRWWRARWIVGFGTGPTAAWRILSAVVLFGLLLHLVLVSMLVGGGLPPPRQDPEPRHEAAPAHLPMPHTRPPVDGRGGAWQYVPPLTERR